MNKPLNSCYSLRAKNDVSYSFKTVIKACKTLRAMFGFRKQPSSTQSTVSSHYRPLKIWTAPRSWHSSAWVAQQLRDHPFLLRSSSLPLFCLLPRLLHHVNWIPFVSTCLLRIWTRKIVIFYSGFQHFFGNAASLFSNNLSYSSLSVFGDDIILPLSLFVLDFFFASSVFILKILKP